MLTDEELIALWTGDESDRVEFKHSAKAEDLRDYICAFANDLPGHGKPGAIFLGLHKDRSCANLAVTDALMNRLSNLRTDGAILPLTTMRIGRRTLRGCTMVVIEVEPADHPPVTHRGALWVRTGTSLHRASTDEERRLIERRRFHQRTFDSRPVPHASHVVIPLAPDLYLSAGFTKSGADAARLERGLGRKTEEECPTEPVPAQGADDARGLRGHATRGQAGSAGASL